MQKMYNELTLRRYVDGHTLSRCFDFVNLVKIFKFSTAKDTPIQMLEPSGSYSVKSFLQTNQFWVVSSDLKDFIWKIKVSPNIHVFLWLIIHSKSLTRDNLDKRRPVADPTCFFCRTGIYTISIFYCIVAQKTWSIITEILNIHVPCSFMSLHPFWKQRKHPDVVNLVTSATLWGYWLLRNDFVFQGQKWRSLRCILDLVGSLVMQWKILCSDAQAVPLLRCIRLLDHHRGELLMIAWPSYLQGV